jgi:hypothetical protein
MYTVSMSVSPYLPTASRLLFWWSEIGFNVNLIKSNSKYKINLQYFFLKDVALHQIRTSPCKCRKGYWYLARSQRVNSKVQASRPHGEVPASAAIMSIVAVTVAECAAGRCCSSVEHFSSAVVQRKDQVSVGALRPEDDNLVFWGPRSFQFDLEKMNINIYCMHYIIREDYWRP